METKQKQLEMVEFLQSGEWGHFQQSVGKEVAYFDVGGQNIQGFVHKLGLGFKYLYLPRLLISDFRFQILVDKIKDLDFSFIRIEPIEDLSKIRSTKSVTNNRQPRTTLILDLIKSEDELLVSMHSKTRYNIRLAEKKGIEIKQEKNVDIFWKLNKQTTDRDEFKSHDKEYYESMLEMDICYQLTAYFEDEPIASNILIIYKNACTYLHGSSGDKHRNLMAPYLLQWKAMQLAKEKDCHYYDFWGVAPMLDEEKVKTTCFNNFCWTVDHKWTGVTRFKVGFGGVVKKYPQAFDIILQKNKYRLYKFIKKFL